jgi:hypothetical protein
MNNITTTVIVIDDAFDALTETQDFLAAHQGKVHYSRLTDRDTMVMIASDAKLTDEQVEDAVQAALDEIHSDAGDESGDE